MNNTCSNCELWTRYPGERRGLCVHPETLVYDTDEDIFCPRHEIKVEFPDWTPEWHPGSEMPKKDPELNNCSVNVFAFFGNGWACKAFCKGSHWFDMGKLSALHSTPLCWTYLPEGYK